MPGPINLKFKKNTIFIFNMIGQRSGGLVELAVSLTRKINPILSSENWIQRKNARVKIMIEIPLFKSSGEMSLRSPHGAAYFWNIFIFLRSGYSIFFSSRNKANYSNFRGRFLLFILVSNLTMKIKLYVGHLLLCTIIRVFTFL